MTDRAEASQVTLYGLAALRHFNNVINMKSEFGFWSEALDALKPVSYLNFAAYNSPLVAGSVRRYFIASDLGYGFGL